MGVGGNQPPTTSHLLRTQNTLILWESQWSQEPRARNWGQGPNLYRKQQPCRCCGCGFSYREPVLAWRAIFSGGDRRPPCHLASLYEGIAGGGEKQAPGMASRALCTIPSPLRVSPGAPLPSLPVPTCSEFLPACNYPLTQEQRVSTYVLSACPGRGLLQNV